jgi:uncharacterized protein YndB with AHSA1/START domain
MAAGTRPVLQRLEDGTVPFEGALLEVDPPRRLASTFHYVGDAATRVEHPSRDISQVGEACKTDGVHDEFADNETATFTRLGDGWPYILSSLKSVLEAGQPLALRA